MSIRILEYKVRFVTPAFLGNAEQNGQWRTPPFKALLRQWWRVAKTSGRAPNTAEVQRCEGELFGRASDAGTTASQVRLRIDWRDSDGLLPANKWKAETDKVRHDEAEKALFKVDAALYLGYGPLDVDNVKGHRLKRPSACAPNKPRSLKLRVPSAQEQTFRNVARLTHAFGSLGSRCRNGWGSLHFDHGGLPSEEVLGLLDVENRASRDWLRSFSRPWTEALDTDWCHSLGRDDSGLLLWRTQTMKKWEEVLTTFAEIKIAFRTQFHFKGRGSHTALCDRQLLAYPIANHELRNWDRNANQVVFKVLPSDGGYVGLIVHLPHALPTVLEQLLKTEDRQTLGKREWSVWRQVHELLDNASVAQERISRDSKLSDEAKKQSLRVMQQLTRLP
jgi:CRISPR-associated protein Cmr1